MNIATIKATITSKGQVTIPIEVRDYLGLDKSSKIGFEFSKDADGNKTVIVRKVSTEGVCPVCDGDGKIENIECIVCRGTGKVERKTDVIGNLLDAIKAYKEYRIGFGVEYQGYLGNSNIHHCPNLILTSDALPQDILDKIHDYFQMELLLDLIQRDMVDYEDGMLSAMQDSMKTEEGKGQLRSQLKNISTK